MPQLSGKVAIVTGAARGMGAAEADLLAAEGAAVAVCDVLPERATSVAADIVSRGGGAIAVPLDVTSEAGWRQALAQVEKWRGRVDILVNNAGINLRGGVADLSQADWDRVLAVNLSGAFLGMQIVAPVMRRGGGGSIVNIASAAALTASASAAYTASKWGLRGLSRVAALEFADWGIRVNTVCPGLVLTELNAGQSYLQSVAEKAPMRRAGEIDEIARTVLFLASDAASFITGADIPVDGGLSIGRIR